MSSELNFLQAEGEVAALMRAHDWSASPLGDPNTWPQSLRTIVGFVLTSKFPMFLAWGEGLGCLYNDAYAEILGTKHPAALGQRFYNVWSEIWEEIYPLVERALAGESIFHENLPLTLRRKGFDEQTWFTFSYSPVRDESGAVKGMCCTCIETTEQILRTQHRAQEHERLRDLFQQAPGIMAVVQGPEHVFELVNEAYLQLIGHRNVIGKTVREALPELEGQGFFELLKQVYTSGEPFVGRAIPIKLQRRPGSSLEERFVDFVYQPIRNAQGVVYGIFAQGSDVTEAVRAVDALRESEKRLRDLANTIPHLAWMTDADGVVHWYNERWQEYTGLTVEEVQQRGWTEFVDPQELPALLRRWQASLATGNPYEVTVRLRAADGQYRTFFVRAAPLHDASGKIVQWFGTNTDVTVIKKAQEELMQANRRKDEFLAMLAHELRNPLAPISTAAHLLTLTANDERRVRQASEIITRQVKHMTELVDDLLDVSRVTRGLVQLDKEDLDLKTIISSAIEQVRPLIETRRHVLTTWMAAEHIAIHGDRTRLVQVVANLLSNAAKYTPQGGEIALKVKVKQDQVNISVCDNGIGIDVALLPHIFELFTQAERTPDRSQGGLGIGLALVRSITALHGGQVEAYSEGRDKGSTFTLTLPITQKSAGEQPVMESMPSSQAVAPVRVMIVDDNVDAAQTLAALLEAEGHHVIIKHDATSALNVVEKTAPQVFILDIGLPDMTGYQLARKLRERPFLKQAQFIALTGYGQAHDRVLSKSAGFDHHFVKPVDTQKLAEIFSKIS